MFIGHFALGFGAKRVAPSLSLGTLFLAAQWLDLLWPTLLLAGVERAEIKAAPYHGPPLAFVHYPVSHSLLAVLGWALLLGGVHFALKRERRAALWVGALVVSHWLLDLLVHEPDLPLAPGAAPKLGLGLWWWPLPELVLELGLFAAGVALYLRATRPADATGRWALAALVAFLVVVHLANAFGPPPPGIDAVAWAGQAQWLLVAWGWWVDRHRTIAAAPGRRREGTTTESSAGCG
jgi:hypothetical protein